MTTPRKPLAKAQAELRDDALMELTKALETVRVTFRGKPSTDELYKTITETTIHVTQAILTLKRMDTE